MRESDETATFESFFLTEYPRLVALLSLWTDSRPLAEDLAQDALILAEADWERVRRLDSPVAWVRRVALNRSMNERRRMRRQHHALNRIDRPAVSGVGEADDGVLWAAVRQLSDKQRTAIALYYVDDLPLDEIASVLGCSAGTVKTHLQRGRRRLAELLDDEGT